MRREIKRQYDATPQALIAKCKREETIKGTAKRLIRTAERNSRKRNHPSPTITWRDIFPALERGTCDLSRLPFDFKLRQGQGRRPYAPSLDRPNSSKPYTKKNFRVVLWAVNSGCDTWGLKAYLKIAQAVITNRRKDLQ
jgi:hypothetical protein